MHKTEAYLIGIYRHLTYTWKRQGKQVVTLESEKIQLEIMVKHTYVCMLITKHAFGKLYQNHVILRMIGFFWSFFIYTLKSLQMRNDLNICLSIDLYS